MTFRDYLAKRKARLLWLMIGVVFLAVLCMAAATAMDSKLLMGLGVLWWLAYVPAVMGYCYLVRCPRCKGNIGRHTSHFGLKKTLFFDVINYCPFCGVQLDQPVKADQ